MRRKAAQGLTLVELMVALVLGLLLLGAVLSLFTTTRESYRTNEALARLQETGRYAFEVLGRSLREAGGIPCGSNLPTANVLNNASTTWWANWGQGIQGYEGNDNTFPKSFGTGGADRAAGTDAVIVWSGTGDSGVTIVDHDRYSAQFKVNTTAHGLNDGDIVMACDYRQAAIFQVTNVNSNNMTIVHNTGTGNPGNCSKGLGYPTDCTNPNGNSYSFAGAGTITKLTAHAWYVGCNGRGSCNTPAGRSLYRLRLGNQNGSNPAAAEEIVDGVWDLQLQYLTRDASGALDTQYRDATAVSDWRRVVAVRLELTTRSSENVATTGAPLERKWYAVVTLRNRTP
ncbi:PilW family protein [Hydrogenophilus thiooxidans]|uniref:PilW family protein n=1 Tax=Hydrogenophilus thiooxidans TaxID=2820326 RepID=UPI001C224ED8|nr:PilW family protein [Hydrogenophilus thiooxidans]